MITYMDKILTTNEYWLEMENIYWLVEGGAT